VTLRLAAFLIRLGSGFTPAFAQHVICCNRLIDVGGNWIGASRTCDLSGASPEARAKVCQQFAGCADAAVYCGVERPCTETGSLIDIYNQALGERIRVSGTPFNLYYRSDQIQGGRPDSFPNSLSGWSLDVHHAYETRQSILHGGDFLIQSLFYATAATQQPGQSQLPTPAGYPQQVRIVNAG
jgi:hypothetical protein